MTVSGFREKARREGVTGIRRGYWGHGGRLSQDQSPYGRRHHKTLSCAI